MAHEERIRAHRPATPADGRRYYDALEIAFRANMPTLGGEMIAPPNRFPLLALRARSPTRCPRVTTFLPTWRRAGRGGARHVQAMSAAPPSPGMMPRGTIRWIPCVAASKSLARQRSLFSRRQRALFPEHNGASRLGSAISPGGPRGRTLSARRRQGQPSASHWHICASEHREAARAFREDPRGLRTKSPTPTGVHPPTICHAGKPASTHRPFVTQAKGRARLLNAEL